MVPDDEMSPVITYAIVNVAAEPVNLQLTVLAKLPLLESIVLHVICYNFCQLLVCVVKPFGNMIINFLVFPTGIK